MKTREQILKMTKAELEAELNNQQADSREYRSHDCSCCTYCDRCNHCNHCNYCDDCKHCNHCNYCHHCSYSFALCKESYMICNVQFTKEEYEAKMRELALFGGIE